MLFTYFLYFLGNFQLARRDHSSDCNFYNPVGRTVSLNRIEINCAQQLTATTMDITIIDIMNTCESMAINNIFRAYVIDMHTPTATDD